MDVVPIRFNDPTGHVQDAGGGSGSWQLPVAQDEQPCKVIVGAKKISAFGTGELNPYHHAFILVADPNRTWRPGVAPPPDITDDFRLETPLFGEEIPGHIRADENVTVYYFRAGPDGSHGIWGNLATENGYYEEKTIDYLPDNGRYKTLETETDVDCASTLSSLRKSMYDINSASIDYYPWARNSNTVVNSALDWSGLPQELPSTADDWWDTTPQFDENIFDWNWPGKNFN